MGKKLIATALLIAALIWLPSPAKNINNSEQAAASKVGTMRKQRAETGDDSKTRSPKILTTEAGTQVQQNMRKAPKNAPTKPIAAVETEAPNSEKAKAVNVQTSVKASEPEPQTQGCERYRSLVSKYDWDVRIALAVMQAENGCKPGGPASSTCDRGLMQINCVHADMVNSLDDLYDPATNISVAYKVYLGRKQQTGNGWLAWNAYKNGSYRKFL